MALLVFSRFLNYINFYNLSVFSTLCVGCCQSFVSLSVNLHSYCYYLIFIAVFNNMRTLKFKVKLTIRFYAAVNHYRNSHPKAETSKMDRNPPIMNQERDLLTSLKYRTCFLRVPRYD